MGQASGDSPGRRDPEAAERVCRPGGARPPTQVLRKFIDRHCRSPRGVIGATLRSCACLTNAALGLAATRSWRCSYNACGKPTFRSMASMRSGSRSHAREAEQYSFLHVPEQEVQRVQARIGGAHFTNSNVRCGAQGQGTDVQRSKPSVGVGTAGTWAPLRCVRTPAYEFPRAPVDLRQAHGPSARLVWRHASAILIGVTPPL